MKTVLIVMESGSFAKVLKRELKRDCRVLTAEDTQTLAAILEEEAPEVLVLDLQLPGLDPIGFLRERKGNFRILAITKFMSSYLAEALAGLGISYLMVRPCQPETVARRALELLEPVVGAEGRLRQLLGRFSVPTDILGGRCLLLAIPRAEEVTFRLMVGKLYPMVGQTLGMDWQLVERNIRYAIAKGWKEGSRELWLRHYPKGKPTNGEFIARMGQLNRGIAPEPENVGIKQENCG